MKNFTNNSSTLSEISEYSDMQIDKKSVIDDIQQTFDIRKNNISYDDKTKILYFSDVGDMPYTVVLRNAEGLDEVDKEVLDIMVDESYQLVYTPKYTRDELKGVKAEIRGLYYPKNNEVNYNPRKKTVTFVDDRGMSYSVDLSDYEVFEYPDDVYVLNTVEIDPVPKYTMDELKSVFAEIQERYNIEKVDIGYDYPYDILFTACDKMGYYVMDYRLDLSQYETYIYDDIPYVPKKTVLDYEPLYTIDELIDIEEYIENKYPGKNSFSMNNVWCEYATFKYDNKVYFIDFGGATVYRINGRFYAISENDINIHEDGLIPITQYYADKYCISEEDIVLSDNTISFTGINGVKYSAAVNDEIITFNTFPGINFVKASYNQLAVPEKTSSLPENYYRAVKQIQRLTGLTIDTDIVQDERYYILVLGTAIPFDAGVIYTKYDSVYTTPEDFMNGLLKMFPINVKEELESMGFGELRNNSGTAVYTPIGYNTNTKKMTLFGKELDIEKAIYVGEKGNRNTNSNLGSVLVNAFSVAFNSSLIKSDDIKNYICAYYNFNSSVCSVNGYTVTFMDHVFSIGDDIGYNAVTMGGVRFIRKEYVELQISAILEDIIDAGDAVVSLASYVGESSKDLFNAMSYNTSSNILYVGGSEISDEDIIYDPNVEADSYTSYIDYVRDSAYISPDVLAEVVDENRIQPTTVITVPIDSRPVSNQYFKLLTEIGGDNCEVITEGLDGGMNLQSKPISVEYTKFTIGNSVDTRASLLQKVNSIVGNKTIIINTASCFTNGLIGSRMPTSYYGLDENGKNKEAIEDLTFKSSGDGNAFIDTWIDYLEELHAVINEQGSDSRIYVHCAIPRTEPGAHLGNCTHARPGNNNGTWAEKAWEFESDGLGLSYFKDPNNYQTTSCRDILREWSYLENKYLHTKKDDGTHGLEDYEWNCLVHYNEMYRYNDSPYRTDIFNAYNNLYVNAEYFIIKLMECVSNGVIDELIIGVDDINFPEFYNNDVSFDKGSVKYSFAQTCLDNIMNYHINNLQEIDNINDSIECCAEHINYLLGTDETPQVIYARDLTRRMHRTPKYVNYALYGTGSMDNVGQYDIDTISDVLRKTQNFITNTSYYYYDDPNEYSKPRDYINNAVHEVGEMHTFIRCDEKIKNENDAIIAAKSIYNAFNDPYADSSDSHPRRFNDGNINMCILDSALGGENPNGDNSKWLYEKVGADWLLLHTLKNVYSNSLNDDNYSHNSISQLAAYSAWNTVGNSIGVGLAHAQVFGIMDSTYDNMDQQKAKSIIEAHIKMLAIHLLEDALYNRMKQACEMFSDTYAKVSTLDRDIYILRIILNDVRDIYQKSEIETAGATADGEDGKEDVYGGRAWVFDRFKDPGCIHRFNNYSYEISDIGLSSVDLPWKRKFECFIELNAEVNNITQN